jgi:alpha-mannosidase
MKPPTLHLICNAHLDPVWRWRWEEGCAEALSTFHVAVELLEEHTQLIFNHNEAVLYQWVQEYAPDLFRRIQALVQAGRWCISGGWFLQPDVNLPDTESLIRQITTGRAFFREHFGVEPRVAYNFDSFGHSAGLPQLLVRSGYAMYIHMRPQAQDLTLPSDLYRWRGLDGSEILTLRIVVGLYHTERDNLVSRLEEGVALALKLNRDVPVFWGIGDHGGGATREDLQRLDAFMQRETRVAIVHSSTERLYAALQEAGKQAPIVEGELQRVFTGCYTSLARLKRQSVKSLGSVIQAEALRTATWWRHDQEYPASALNEVWRDHLFNDFHDILPGSCVEPAEQDALALYGKVSSAARRLRLGTAAAFNAGQPLPLYLPVTVLNTNPSCPCVPVEVEAMLDCAPSEPGNGTCNSAPSPGRLWLARRNNRRRCYLSMVGGAKWSSWPTCRNSACSTTTWKSTRANASRNPRCPVCCMVQTPRPAWSPRSTQAAGVSVSADLCPRRWWSPTLAIRGAANGGVTANGWVSSSVNLAV